MKNNINKIVAEKPLISKWNVKYCTEVPISVIIEIKDDLKELFNSLETSDEFAEYYKDECLGREDVHILVMNFIRSKLLGERNNPKANVELDKK